MPLLEKTFGKVKDKNVQLFVLSNSNDYEAHITNYGGTLVHFFMPDKDGNGQSICLGFDNLEDYLGDQPFIGALIGRFANRISKGRFELDGKTYQLACNEKGKNHLHGGEVGFDKVVWDAKPFESRNQAGVELTYRSVDGEEGYPGTVDANVVYTLNEENELKIEYTAHTDKPTPINLTNHAYWNLAGAGKAKIYDHQLELKSVKCLAVDDDLIPTGDFVQVTGTPLDFQSEKRIGDDIDRVGVGYDHCFVIDRSTPDLERAAALYEPSSKRHMEVWTTKPAIQFYTGNFLDGLKGAGGVVYNSHHGLCLETEFYPDAVNHENFPSAILRPGEVYHHTTVHKFSIK